MNRLLTIERTSLSWRLLISSLPIFSVERNQKGVDYFFLNRRFLRCRLPLRYELKRQLNIQLMEKNTRSIRKLEGDRNRRILYVTTTLSMGGVETRLTSQFAFLKEEGITPILLTERNDCPALMDEVNLSLDFTAPNAEELLIELIHECKADAVEFQLKSPRFIESLDLDKLQRHARVGVCLHGKVGLSPHIQKQLDYFLAILSYRNLARKPAVIRNWIRTNTEQARPVNTQSNQALFVSRLDKEKFPTLANFVKLCREYNLTPIIAGGGEFSLKFVRLIRTLNLPDSAFIGSIDTIRFLQQHGSEFLFIAGVGQVPLEAASLGLPAMVVPHKEDAKLATVLTDESFHYLRDWNFVIRQCPNHECLGNFNEFLRACKEGDVEKFNARLLVEEYCGIEGAMHEYLRLVFPDQSE